MLRRNTNTVNRATYELNHKEKNKNVNHPRKILLYIISKEIYNRILINNKSFM
jgi:hypothetical protein